MSFFPPLPVLSSLCTRFLLVCARRVFRLVEYLCNYSKLLDEHDVQFGSIVWSKVLKLHVQRHVSKLGRGRRKPGIRGYTPSAMSTHYDNLSSLPPATLRAALHASEERVSREKEEIQRKIEKLQKRLNELEEGEDAPKPEEDAVSGFRARFRRTMVVSSSEDEAVEARLCGRLPIAKPQKVDPGRVSPLRYVRSQDETLVSNDGVHSPSCTKCRTKGIRCEWDKNSTSQRYLTCQRSKLGCDLKRQISGGPGAA